MVRENRDFPKNNFKERSLMKDSQITFVLKNSSKRKQWSLYIVRMSEMRKIQTYWANLLFRENVVFVLVPRGIRCNGEVTIHCKKTTWKQIL